MDVITLTQAELNSLLAKAATDALAEVTSYVEYLENRRANDRAHKKSLWATDKEFRDNSKKATKALRQKRIAQEPGYREKLNRQSRERRARYRQDPDKMAEENRKRREYYRQGRAKAN